MPKPTGRSRKTSERAERRRRIPPLSTRAQDPPEFVERVQAESRRKFGGSIEEIARDPMLRDVAYAVLADVLRQPPKKIPDDVLAVVARMAEAGITVTPGTCDPRDLPVPLDLGISLTDAVLEERYGVERDS